MEQRSDGAAGDEHNAEEYEREDINQRGVRKEEGEEELDENEEEEEYEYVYQPDENEDEDDCCGVKRPLEGVEEIFSLKRKYLDADGYSLRLWSEGKVIRMAIVSSLRQIIDHQSNLFRILCSSDQLEIVDLSELVVSVFVDVAESMTVVYELKFNTEMEMAFSPPRLHCLTYCGAGTFLFPDHLLPHRFSKFLNFGQLFFDLSQELRSKGYDKKMIPFYSIAGDHSFCLPLQELCYKTQYETRAILRTSEASIVTGLERRQDETTTHTSRGRKGIGYSVGSEGSHSVDHSYLESLTQLLDQIADRLPPALSPALPNPLESPLEEILSLIVFEYSFEELTRSPTFSRALLVTIGKLEALSQASLAQQAGAGGSGQQPQQVWLFSRQTYEKIVRFKEIVGKESEDEFGLETLRLPTELHDLQFQSLRVGTDPDPTEEAVKSLPHSNDLIEPVIFIESFKRHSYFVSEKPIQEAISPTLLRRMRIEFSTLQHALPETIKLLVLESHYTYSKFLIIGPSDTPYEGGFFLFDMKLPTDYPETSPSVTFLTTGGGTVRFNPNLYNSGKVCLSLLGTWSGERWDPKISNLNQVLQSISFLILVPEPFYNEPGFEQQQGTSQGDTESRQYSANIRIQTIRHAVLGHLTHPDPEFKLIIRQLLRAQWGRMKAVYLRWATEEESGTQILDLVSRIERLIDK
jgi:ubiquitin-protein ligase